PQVCLRLLRSRFSVSTVFDRPYRVCESVSPRHRRPFDETTGVGPYRPPRPIVHASGQPRAAYPRARMRTPSSLTGKGHSAMALEKEKKVRRSRRVNLRCQLGFTSDDIQGEAHVTNISTGGCRAESDI